MPFQPFDPRRELTITRQDLPHWRQTGTTYFVTSRLADSLPAAVLESWSEERSRWLAHHRVAGISSVEVLSEDLRQEYHRRFTARWHEWLDAGHGDCFLRRPKVAALFATTLISGHPATYELDAWVVMPNHFHALLRPTDRTLEKIMQTLKGVTARRANQHLGRSGPFWQSEAYDHIVRHEAQLWHYRRYIAENPAKGNLPATDFVLGFGTRTGFNPETLLAHLNQAPE